MDIFKNIHIYIIIRLYNYIVGIINRFMHKYDCMTTYVWTLPSMYVYLVARTDDGNCAFIHVAPSAEASKLSLMWFQQK